MRFLCTRFYYVRVHFVRVKSCIALIPCIKVDGSHNISLLFNIRRNGN